MKSNKKLLFIALDAAEPSLIEQWTAEGELKNLAELRKQGMYCKLNSSAEWLAGSPWPTFYTGTLPGEHGFYHYLQWRSDKMNYERPNPEWIRATPFWRNHSDDIRVIEVDIPLTFPPAEINGIVISNWASHDRLYPPISFPSDKINWVVKNFGSPPISDEVGGLQTVDDLLKLKDELINANKMEAELVSSLIKNEDWNLFLCCFSSTHRAGHKFWDTTNVKGEISETQKKDLRNCLKDIYKSCDEAVGKILQNVSDDTTIFLASLHGFGENTSLADKILPKMLSSILSDKSEKKNESISIIKKFRNLIPLELRSNLRKLLPVWLQDKMTAYWRMSGIDWSKTKVFPMLADLQGYIRINLNGRERDGIVEPEEYEQVCIRIIEGLITFHDEHTNEPVINSIKRKDELFKKGNGFDNLPDILVKWNFKPAASYERIVSKEFGAIEFSTPGKNIDGRSGNHRPQGFLIAKGIHYQPNSTLSDKHIFDLAPTILNYFGLKIPPSMTGNKILRKDK